MKIAETSNTMQIPSVSHSASSPTSVTKTGKSFVDLIDSLRGNSFRELTELQQKLSSKSGSLPTQELILYQIKVQNFSTRIEMLSKVAESGVTAVKKFQQGH